MSGGERAIKGKTGDTGHHGDTIRGANNLGLAVQSNNYTGICVWIAWWRSWSSLNRRCPLIVSSISRFPSHCETCRSDDVVRDMLKFSLFLPLLSTIIQLLSLPDSLDRRNHISIAKLKVAHYSSKRILDKYNRIQSSSSGIIGE